MLATWCQNVRTWESQSVTVAFWLNQYSFGLCLDLEFASIFDVSVLSVELDWLVVTSAVQHTRWWFSLVADPIIHAPWSVVVKENGFGMLKHGRGIRKKDWKPLRWVHTFLKKSRKMST